MRFVLRKSGMREVLSDRRAAISRKRASRRQTGNVVGGNEKEGTGGSEIAVVVTQFFALNLFFRSLIAADFFRQPGACVFPGKSHFYPRAVAGVIDKIIHVPGLPPFPSPAVLVKLTIYNALFGTNGLFATVGNPTIASVALNTSLTSTCVSVSTGVVIAVVL